MDEISNVLDPNENVIWRGKPKANSFYASRFLGIIVFLAAAGFVIYFVSLGGSPSLSWWIFGISALTILIIISTILNYHAMAYAVTNKRIIFQSGIIGRDFKSVDYDQIKNISANVGLVDKMFGTGSIRIFTGEIGVTQTTSGPGMNPRSQTVSKFDIITNIENPYELLKNIQGLISGRKEKLYGGKE